MYRASDEIYNGSPNPYGSSRRSEYTASPPRSIQNKGNQLMAKSCLTIIKFDEKCSLGTFRKSKYTVDMVVCKPQVSFIYPPKSPPLLIHDVLFLRHLILHEPVYGTKVRSINFCSC